MQYVTTMSALILKGLMVLLIPPDPVFGFLLDGQCLGFPPCTCSSNYVFCRMGNTGKMPTFRPSNITENSLYVSVRESTATNIPTYAFRNISLSKTTRVYLFLCDNKINTIDYGAFAGIEENVVQLDLRGNLLTSIPSAVASLTKLDFLMLSDNPIRSLATSTNALANLGRHLTTLYLDLSKFSRWPTELSYLKKLSVLSLTNIEETHLDLDVFNGYQNTLLTLSMSSTRFTELPAAVCHLHKIESLAFTSNVYVHGNSPIFEPCSEEIRSLSSLYLNNNGIRYFPANLFKTFSSLSNIELDRNQLTYIDSDVLPANLSIASISLKYNNFMRIPYAIKKFHSLIILDLSHNKITTIEESDLYVDAPNFLQQIYLNNNPIEYISSYAFVNANQLYILDLQYTNIQHIPSSLSKLPNLRDVRFTGSPIECSCKLTYLTTWDITSMSITGNCEKTPISIETYIRDDLPQC